MSDTLYLLSSKGNCSYCKKSAEDKEIVICIACDQRFHAVCNTYDKNTAICVKTFFPMFLTSKPGFGWRCDVCITKSEINNISTVHEKMNSLDVKIDSLADTVKTLVDLVANKLAITLQDVNKNISDEITSKITTEFDKIKSSITTDITALKMPEQITTIDSPTVPSTVWDNREKVKEVRTSLLIKRNAASGTAIDIDKLEKTAIANGIPVNSVHVTESGDTFINLPDKASRDKLQPLLRDTDPTNEIVTLKSKLPTIALLGVTREYSKPETINMILKQNEVVRLLVEDGSHLSVLYTKAPVEGKQYHQLVLRVSPHIRRAITNQNNKLHMGKLVHKVVDRFYIRRCNRCQTYGHHQDKCPTPRTPVCGYCAENTHMSTDCPIKSGPNSAFSCHNCKSKDLVFKGHSTFWYNCTSYKEQQRKLERSINYDYSN